MEYEIVRKKFWDGIDKDEGNNNVITYNFDDNGFNHAILRAFRDLTQRTMKRKNSSKSVTVKELRDFVCNKNNYKGDKKSFLALLKEYFETDNYPDYNEWHKLACESIETCLKKYYEDESVSYGKEQKIVNMTMKGIYCLEGAVSYVEKFKPCHMALDSFTLEWFYRCCNIEKYKNKKFAKDIGRKNLSVWSNMGKETVKLIDKNTKNKTEYQLFGYYDVQERITSLVQTIESEKQASKPDFTITPFEAEFYIWPQMQITIAAETLYSNFSDDKGLKEFKAKDVKDKYKILSTLFNATTYEDPCFV